MIASSAISFRLTAGSISAAASTDSPFSVPPFGFPSCRLSTFQAWCLFRFCFLSPAVFAFFRPLQFWVTTTQPLFLPFRSSRFCLTVASPVHASALASSFSPFRFAWFPMLPFPVPVLGFLYVSFCPSLLRSHSCSTGAYLLHSLSVFSLSFHALIDRFRSGSGYSAFCFFFSFSSLPCLTAAPQVLWFCLSVSPFSPSVQPGFPCLPFGFKYSAFCLFPFILPSFAPTAVPLVLTSCFRFRSFPGHFRFLSSASFPFRLLSLCAFLSLLPVLPSQWFFRCLFIHVPFRLFPCFPFRFGTRLPAIPFSDLRFASQWLPRILSLLPFGFRPFPLSQHLRFWLLGLGDTP